MLLVLDVGNSNTVIGVFDGDDLLRQWRIVTGRFVTSDEYYILFKELLDIAGLSYDDFHGVAISCVVPAVQPALLELCGKFFGIEPLVVGPGIKTGMSIHVDNPREVGADRIVNAVAAFEEVQSSIIVVDFGTATTFDFITSKGAFEGGIIAPGMWISMDALFKNASKLPKVEMTRPPRVIGKNTVNAMQSGIVLGYAGMVDSMIDRIKKEIKKDWPGEPVPEVVATGGLANTLARETKAIKKVDDNLTLKGLKIIHQRNRGEDREEGPGD